MQWNNILWPMIKGADFSRTIDLAAGHGRNSARLLPHTDKLIIADINDSNIEFCRARFGNEPKISFIKNNGFDLRELEDHSITFVYCFDAMVHFDSDVVRSYIKEFKRIMSPGATGFCHYSNNYHSPTKSYTDHPGWRNFMSRQLFEHWLAKEGFDVLESRYVSGVCEFIVSDNGNCDAVTLFQSPKFLTA